MRERIWRKSVALLLAGALFFAILPIFSANTRKKPPVDWEEIASFTTYYSQKDGGRCANIAIAASLIDGVTLQPYGEFSFNQTVGRRTAEAGFRQAKIIVNGEYVAGVGGGVCQVSTTLYNAALTSGLAVTEFHPHSLRVGYVDPSRDAMVSSHSDLKLYNPKNTPVFLSARIFDGGIKIAFFGKKDGGRYAIVAKILEEIPAPPPIIKASESEEKILRKGQAGIRSEAYLERYEKGCLVSRRRLRTDTYQPIQEILAKKNQEGVN